MVTEKSQSSSGGTTKETTKKAGDAGEDRALAHLLRHGLVLVQRNYRVAKGPRSRGGGAASIGAAKQRSLVFAAQHFLRTQRTVPPCRFDVVAIEGERIEWLKAAFDTS